LIKFVVYLQTVWGRLTCVWRLSYRDKFTAPVVQILHSEVLVLSVRIVVLVIM